MKIQTIKPQLIHIVPDEPAQQPPKQKKQGKKFASHPKIREIGPKELRLVREIQENDNRILSIQKEIEDAAYWSVSTVAKVGYWLCLITTVASQAKVTPYSGALGAFLMITPRRSRLRDEKWAEVLGLFALNAHKEQEIMQPGNHKGRNKLKPSKARIDFLSNEILKQKERMEEHRSNFNDNKVCRVFSDMGWISVVGLFWSINCLSLKLPNETPEFLKDMVFGAAAITALVSGVIGGGIVLEEVSKKLGVQLFNNTREKQAEEDWKGFVKAAREHAALSCEPALSKQLIQ